MLRFVLLWCVSTSPRKFLKHSLYACLEPWDVIQKLELHDLKAMLIVQLLHFALDVLQGDTSEEAYWDGDVPPYTDSPE